MHSLIVVDIQYECKIFTFSAIDKQYLLEQYGHGTVENRSDCIKPASCCARVMAVLIR
jgi:hypothetical protein